VKALNRSGPTCGKLGQDKGQGKGQDKGQDMRHVNRKLIDIHDRVILVKTLTGSRADGTNVTGSDTDFVTVVSDTPQELLGTEPKKKGRFFAGDDDKVIYTLSHFVDVILNGSDVATNILFASRKNAFVKSNVWDILFKNRLKFLNLATYQAYLRHANKMMREGRDSGSSKKFAQGATLVFQLGELVRDKHVYDGRVPLPDALMLKSLKIRKIGIEEVASALDIDDRYEYLSGITPDWEACKTTVDSVMMEINMFILRNSKCSFGFFLD